jgi:TRAP-type uncharacterized transport system fused permease subunit
MAAWIPALLYYLGLLMQVDAYAAKTGLKGLPPKDVPRVWTVLKQGWPFLTVILFLVWALLYMRLEELAPFYASGLLIVLSFASRKTMLTPRKILDTLVGACRLITMTTAALLPIGIIIAGLVVPGATLSIAGALTALGGQSIFLLLLLAAAISFIMGMVGLPNYIFLAITMAPAIIKVGGLNPLAVHLFLMYWSTLGLITPPVAVAAFVGASIAGADPIKTSVTASRLGIVLFFIPFFFVYNEALVLQGPLLQSLYLFVQALVGIALVAGGLEGYLLWVGALKPWSRAVVIAAGGLIAFPHIITLTAGLAVGVPVIIALMLTKRRTAKVLASQ